MAERGRPGDKWLLDTARWAWRTKLRPTSSSICESLWQLPRTRLFGSSPATCAICFSPPRLERAPTLGLDPGFRTGVKVAVVDATGKVVATDRSIRTSRERHWDEFARALARLCRTHNVELVAIGNGTASRETDKLAGELLARHRT